MELQVKNKSGGVVGTVDADDAVWAVKPNKALLHQAVVAQRANKRQGTHDTQTRAEVSYSTRKLRAQKGTGRARLGTRRSPNLVGGGVAHGPHPRSYYKRLPKKMKKQALKIALSEHVRADSLIVLDDISLDSAKTRSLVQIMEALNTNGKSLIVVAEKDNDLLMSCSNLESVSVLEAKTLSPLQAVLARNLLVTKDAVTVIDKFFGEKEAEK